MPARATKPSSRTTPLHGSWQEGGQSIQSASSLSRGGGNALSHAALIASGLHGSRRARVANGVEDSEREYRETGARCSKLSVWAPAASCHSGMLARTAIRSLSSKQPTRTGVGSKIFQKSLVCASGWRIKSAMCADSP
ncbi:MAG: hypothetical protein MZU91_12965 [Desulfosudis oleivorans]|nr:hypothetical protein [Desulfosudis oleivorans]